MSDFRLRKLRQSKGVQFSELAKQFNVSESTLSRWEVGSSEPDYDTLAKLAEYFGVSTDYLLGIANTPQFSEEELRKMMNQEDPLCELKISILMYLDDLSKRDMIRVKKICEMFIYDDEVDDKR